MVHRTSLYPRRLESYCHTRIIFPASARSCATRAPAVFLVDIIFHQLLPPRTATVLPWRSGLSKMLTVPPPWPCSFGRPSQYWNIKTPAVEYRGIHRTYCSLYIAASAMPSPCKNRGVISRIVNRQSHTLGPALRSPVTIDNNRLVVDRNRLEYLMISGPRRPFR